MNLNYNNTTFVIVTFKSEKIIHECLKTLPINYKKIIIENSANIKFKEDLEKNYENLEVFLSKNLGMGASNNIGIKKCKTDYAYVINPDVKFNEETLSELNKSLKTINDFAILSPLSNDPNYPNYKHKARNSLSKDIISVDSIDGYSMLINKKKFNDNLYFDENFFLYLENDDLCLRKKKENEYIYIFKNSLIEHLGGGSSNSYYKEELEYSRNWHWMWSKFYFNKKHYGINQALIKSSLNFLSSLVKYFFYSAIFNQYKKKIYKMRLSGISNAIIGKPSWYRPNINF